MVLPQVKHIWNLNRQRPDLVGILTPWCPWKSSTWWTSDNWNRSVRLKLVFQQFFHLIKLQIFMKNEEENIFKDSNYWKLKWQPWGMWEAWMGQWLAKWTNGGFIRARESINGFYEMVHTKIYFHSKFLKASICKLPLTSDFSHFLANSDVCSSLTQVPWASSNTNPVAQGKS